ncbi:unnamed protein product [marine sediment metagenome]|uniref:Uncharacterized protein n=1 Tax=marine sediment metagenome TaxID=412755 RepID=X1LFG8_9ZZZZ
MRGLFRFFFPEYFWSDFRTKFFKKEAEKLAREIDQSPHLGYKIVKFLDPRKNISSQVKRKNIETLIIARDLNGSSKLTQGLYQCLPLKINFMDLARAYEIFSGKIPIDFVSQTWFLENLAEGEKKIYDKLKRFFDTILGALIIVLTSPLWLIFAILIKSEDKGVCFLQTKKNWKR